MSRVELNEVVLRDGLQNESTHLATADKVRLADALSPLGFARLEASSFTSPKAIPALADADEVLARIARPDGLIVTALVPNRRGAERALRAGLDEMNVVVSASETHNLANLAMTRRASVRALGEVIALAHDAGVPVNVSISCCFGCPMEGEVPSADVLRLIEALARLGVIGVSICDTTGVALPSQVRALCREVAAAFPELARTLHLHDTRGLALANLLAALEVGVTRFDSALGGLGGCPYAPGASGNVATEDVVHLLHHEGVDCGVALEPLLAISPRLEALVGHPLASSVARAGDRDRRYDPPPGFDAIRERALEREAAETSSA